MFLLFLGACCFLFATLCIWKHKKLLINCVIKNSSDKYDIYCWHDYGFYLRVVGSFILLLSILLTMAGYSTQIYDMEEIRRLNEQIYLSKVEVLTNDYRNQLLLKSTIEKGMRVRAKNPWIYYFLIPEYQEN